MTAAARAGSRRSWVLGMAVLLTSTRLAMAQAHTTPSIPAATMPAPGGGELRALELTLAPLLGEEASGTRGWMTYLARLTNNTATSAEGTLTLSAAAPSWLGPTQSKAQPLINTRFSVAAGSSVTLQLPVSGRRTQDVEARAENDRGQVLATANSRTGPIDEPLIFDTDNESRLPTTLGGHELPGPPPVRRSAPATPVTRRLSVTCALSDPDTQEPILPIRAASYAPATLVVADAEQLARMPPTQTQALAGWLLAGGSLAVSAMHPEQLQVPLLERLLGGKVSAKPLPEDVTRPASLELRGADGSEAAALDNQLPEQLLPLMLGFEGGNLRDAPWGASASYGIGEVHVLSFAPNLPPFSGSLWVQGKMLELTQHALARRRHLVGVGATQPFDAPRAGPLRQTLQADTRHHVALILAALGFMAYALLAGPWNFRRARLSGRPLAAYLRLPLFSFTALACVLGLGFVARGERESARRLTLVEAGAGMPRGAAVRHRAFHTSDSSQLRVGLTEEGAVMDRIGRPQHAPRAAWLTGHNLELDQFQAQPWETVLLREEGFADLGRGVSLLDAGSDILVINRLGRALAAVVVNRPDGQAYFHDRVADGAQVLAGSGTKLRPLTGSSIGRGPGQYLNPFRHHADSVAPGFVEAVEAWDSLGAGASDWWPADVPCLLGQVVGGEGTLVDSGLPVKSDRVIIRVVGYGGVP